ncbi:NEDD8-conjugating enzyme UBE2F isoform X1 [Felis catus]|uniref:NEDD8-conjugating enzyme UBE2F isoform X1 n=1 Tax=Felis catus TaxID=9685 RepID=UPI001D19EE91|nr:NEDD8-conjugating enzyme UBE2F isoform X1 [Felis catus]
MNWDVFFITPYFALNRTGCQMGKAQPCHVPPFPVTFVHWDVCALGQCIMMRVTTRVENFSLKLKFLMRTTWWGYFDVFWKQPGIRCLRFQTFQLSGRTLRIPRPKNVKLKDASQSEMPDQDLAPQHHRDGRHMSKFTERTFDRRHRLGSHKDVKGRLHLSCRLIFSSEAVTTTGRRSLRSAPDSCRRF